MKKKLLFIDHEFHKKTKSSVFIQKILEKDFDIELFYFDPYQDNIQTHFSSLNNKEYDAIVCWQIMPNITMLKKYISFKYGTFFPMYDGVPQRNDRIWLGYKDFNIINFSKTLHEELKQLGFSSYYIQYFPQAKTVDDLGKVDSVFFWQRVNEININTVEKLFDINKIKHIHMHKAIDPNHEFIEPQNKELEKKISYSEWFDKKEDMLKKIKESALYIAPRRFEGIGMSFLEAMSMGRCVIAPNFPTMNEYIENGKTGILYDFNNPQKIDLSNIREIQKNAQEYMKEGYQKWQEDSQSINTWIMTPPQISKNLLEKWEKSLNRKHYTKIYLLGFIPFLKIEKNNSETKTKLYIFGIPFLKLKKNKSKEKLYFLGIPLLSTKTQANKLKSNRVKKFMILLASKQKILKRNKILLVDNIFNDNAELIDNYTLFQYLMKQKKYNDKCYYIINKYNIMYNEVYQKYPHNIIPTSRNKINLKLIYHLFTAKYWLDSFQVINRFNLQNILRESDIVTIYMQHGINYFKKGFWGNSQIGDKTFKKIIFSNETERKLFDNYYYYDPKNTILAGLSRWDNMPDKAANEIFIYFTFRVYLRNKELDIKQTRYYKNIMSLLLSKRFNKILKEHNIILNLGFHHEFLRFLDKSTDIFKINNSNVKIIDDIDISEVKKKSALLITDYSSMCFDFMYKDRPVIFYRIDANDELFESDEEGRINDENAESKNSELYNICYETKNVIDLFSYYVEHDFVLEKDKKKKNSKFFTYRKNICQHIIENIVKSPLGIKNKFRIKENMQAIETNKVYQFSENIPIYSFSLYNIENWGRWSCDHEVILGIKLKQKYTGKIILNIRSFAGKTQVGEIYLNNNYLRTYKFKGKGTMEIPIDKKNLLDNNVILKITIKKILSPKQLGINNDNRRLGIGFESIEFRI